jgi:hypothetical protein
VNRPAYCDAVIYSNLIENVRGVYEATSFEDGVPAILGIAHPDIEVVPAVVWVDMEATYRGHDAVRDYFAGLEDVFGRMRYELVELEPIGDVLLAEVVIRAEGKGSGAATSFRAFQLLRFEGRLVRRVEGYGTRDEALAAVSPT